MQFEWWLTANTYRSVFPRRQGDILTAEATKTHAKAIHTFYCSSISIICKWWKQWRDVIGVSLAINPSVCVCVRVGTAVDRART